jgi:CAAX protease family protein
MCVTADHSPCSTLMPRESPARKEDVTKTIKAIIERRPLPTYFALTFALSWGGILLVIGGPGAILDSGEQLERLFPIALPAMLVGPSVAGILLTGLVHGRAGRR